MQVRCDGLVGSLAEIRAAVAASQPTHPYRPSAPRGERENLYDRFRTIIGDAEGTTDQSMRACGQTYCCWRACSAGSSGTKGKRDP